MEVFRNGYALSVEFHATKSDTYLTLTNIYAPCVDTEKLEFLRWLHNMHIPSDENCMLVGVFNLIISHQDRNNHETLKVSNSLGSLTPSLRFVCPTTI
jgi:hypothetical protein